MTASVDGAWQAWDYASSSRDAARGTAGAVIHDALFLPGGRHIVTCDDAGAVRRWNPNTGEQGPVLHQDAHAAYSLAASSALPLLAVGLGGKGGVVIIDTDESRVARRIPAATPHVPSMVFAADGRALIVAASRADVRVYDAVTGVMLQAPADGTSTVRAVALDATGTILAIGSDDGRVRLWYVVGADIPPVAP